MDKRAQNKETLTIKQVVESIKAMHIMMHGTQIGKLMEDESVFTEKALVAQINQQSDTTMSRSRNGKPRMSDQEYCQMLREENYALKNQVRQLKNSSDRAKSLVDANKSSTDTSNADEPKGAKQNETKRKREQAKKVTPMQPAPQVSSPPTRVSGFMLSYSNGMADTEVPEDETEGEDRSNTKTFAYIARVRVPNCPTHQMWKMKSHLTSTFPLQPHHLKVCALGPSVAAWQAVPRTRHKQPTFSILRGQSWTNK